MAVADMLEREERPAYVRFEKRAIENKRESLRLGRYVGQDVVFVLVTPPYSKDCHEEVAENWLKKQQVNVMNGRVPEKWFEFWKESYSRYMKGEELPVNGTPIKTWSAISPNQIKTLLGIGIYTIEDLANCNDEGLKRIGMGANDLRNRAKDWLRAANDHGPLVSEITELKKENGRLKAQNEELINKVNILKSQVENQNVPRETYQETEAEITAADLLDNDSSELDSLKEQYAAKFGKKPHHLMKEEGLRKALEE